MFDIITDSACDLTLDTAKQLQIEVVPFYVSLDGEHYRKEGKEIAVRDFYQFMVDNPSAYPKTSLASIEDFEQAFRFRIPVTCAIRKVVLHAVRYQTNLTIDTVYPVIPGSHFHINNRFRVIHDHLPHLYIIYRASPEKRFLDNTSIPGFSDLTDMMLDDVTIECDMNNGSVPTLYFACASNLGDLKESDLDLDEEFDQMDELKDATQQLIDGANDLADGCVYLMNNYSGNETVNMGTGKELTIKELTELVAKVVGYTGEIKWDPSKPDGTPRKLLDVSKLEGLGFHYKTELEEGIRLTYEDFLHNPMRAER